MVIREIAVDLAEELDDLAAELAQQARRDDPGHAVAAVDRDAHGPRDLRVADNAIDIGIQHLRARFPPGKRSGQRARLDAFAYPLDFVARERVACDNHLEPVVRSEEHTSELQ